MLRIRKLTLECVLGPFRSLEEEFVNRAETGEEMTISQLLLLEWKNVFVDYQDRLCNAASEMIKRERSGYQNSNSDLIIALKETFAELSNGTLSNPPYIYV